ncbi:agmatinase [Kingella kingae]|uniref:agmatinase n=1 Tax=Kingella kingae TaxID=504 RepID=UPI0002584507|nr:agmatinase [Kingella kingae]EIC14582.1 agmatinase [Kingella kingae PYKK081]MBD3613786.1 agmatinase [Kingella kingae]MBD3632037.1 agmatinase [Kingella kingae]MBD3659436.1 agmatinase [Kingella kingae]MDK4569571.1 agmatinase [Kingella kingae]
MQYSALAGQTDNSLVSNNFGFLRLPLNFMPYDSDAEWVITGVPYDMAVSGRSGARFGAEAIRRASVNLAWEHRKFPWTFDVRERLNIVDCGDLVFSFGDSRDFVEKMEAHATQLLQSGKKCLSFGGDHFITLPLLRAHAKHFGKLALIHFDAHTDTYDNGSEYDHGTMFYTAPKEGLIDPARSVQIGIRTEHSKKLPFTVLTAPQVNDDSVEQTVSKIKEVVGDMPVYLTFDIDCLDPSYAPGTGTPVCGGLSSDRALKILRGLTDVNIVGMDVVEVAPSYDHADITALAGATIALEMLYLQGAKKG